MTKKKTAGKTAKNRNEEYNAERVRRWREYAEKRAAEVETWPGYDSTRLVAAEEGKTLPELIVAILCRERLRGKIVRNFRPKKGATLRQSYNAYIDTLYEENESTRSRNNHERELVDRALSIVPHNCSDILGRLNARERRALMRRFYRRGDLTAYEAIDRAIRFAIETSADCRTGEDRRTRTA